MITYYVIEYGSFPQIEFWNENRGVMCFKDKSTKKWIWTGWRSIYQIQNTYPIKILFVGNEEEFNRYLMGMELLK